MGFHVFSVKGPFQKQQIFHVFLYLSLVNIFCLLWQSPSIKFVLLLERKEQCYVPGRLGLKGLSPSISLPLPLHLLLPLPISLWDTCTHALFLNSFLYQKQWVFTYFIEKDVSNNNICLRVCSLCLVNALSLLEQISFSLTYYVCLYLVKYLPQLDCLLLFKWTTTTLRE